MPPAKVALARNKAADSGEGGDVDGKYAVKRRDEC